MIHVLASYLELLDYGVELYHQGHARQQAVGGDGHGEYVLEGAWSVGQILCHIAHEEQIEVHYGLAHQLGEFPAEPRADKYTTIASIKALLTEVHDQTKAYLQGLDDTDLDREIEAPWGQTYRLGSMAWHVIEHEVHHRGELSLILGMLGREGLDA